METVAGDARYLNFGVRYVESEVLFEIGGQGSCKGLVAGIFEQPATVDETGNVGTCDGDLYVLEDGCTIWKG